MFDCVLFAQGVVAWMEVPPAALKQGSVDIISSTRIVNQNEDVLSVDQQDPTANNNDIGTRVKFVLYSNDNFFRSSRASRMPVLSASVGDNSVHNLTEPITYFMQPPRELVTHGLRPVCVYWDEGLNDWSTKGLVTIRSVESEVACKAFHLTAFSVLLDPLAKPLDALNAEVLSVLSYIGLALSSTALVITITTYALFK